MSVNPKANAYEGGLTVDPSAGGGVAAPIGALYVRMGGTPQLWQKFGAGNTQWQQVALTDGDKGDITVSGGGSVFTIDPAAVTTGKIADANVTTVKIADANVTTVKIADANVTTAKIADANVTTIKIADANVTTAKIADGNVTTGKIADANITTPKIADANVTLAKIANIAAARILGSIAGGTPAELTGTQVTALLDAFTSLLKGLVPASGGGTTNFLRADGTWAPPPGDVSGTAGWYGSGLDGAATIGAGTTTLTTDKDYTTLVVQNLGILVTAGYVVHATVSITVDAGGNINNNGASSAGSGGGNGAAGAATSLLGGGGGGNGGTGNGATGTSRAEQPKQLPTTGPTSGSGGAGGAGSGGSSGGGPGLVNQTALNGSPFWLPWAIQGNFPYNTGTKIAGGTGGGGGGGSAGAGGASGGGGGGGIVVLSSPTIANNGAIEAKGGGSSVPTGANAGSGGGGGGGKVIIVCRTFTGTTPNVSGGVAGAKTGTGTQGSDGSTGYVLTLTP